MAQVAGTVDILELGVPFSDPMADGVSIQHASHEALRQGVTLQWILGVVDAHDFSTPIVLMSYLNPLLAYGVDKLAQTAAQVGVAGVIVVDLPYEEARPVHDALRSHGVDLIQLVTPATPSERLKMICDSSCGFVYAVTMTGTTGGQALQPQEVQSYLDRVRDVSQLPVMAGFGIRTPEHVRELTGHANGVIVGSALIDTLRDHQDPGPFIQALYNATYLGTEI